MRAREAAPILAALTFATSCATGGLSAEEVKEQLASPDPQIRRTLARNPQTTADALATLSKDADNLVRFHVVENPTTRPQTIRAMSEDKALIVIDALSRNPRTPPERLAAMARQFRPESAGHVFWQQLIDNPTTPVDVRLELQGKVIAEGDKAARGNPVPADLLKTLAGTWLFEIGPWTKLEVSEGFRASLASGRAQAILAGVKMEKYSLTLTESRAAKLECPGTEAMIGTWSAPGGKLRVEMRRRGPVSWRLEGSAPASGRMDGLLALETTYRPVAETGRSGERVLSPGTSTAAAEETDSARWTVELRRTQ